MIARTPETAGSSIVYLHSTDGVLTDNTNDWCKLAVRDTVLAVGGLGPVNPDTFPALVEA